jgi:2-polyprenyl-3-methyl-5-hydroxy-6-metoxy-1,4-benzoquinol methylase
MHGTVILVTGDHARSISAVLGELAVAARELSTDGVTFDLLLVDAGSTDGSIDVARSAADDLGLSLDVVASTGRSAWITQRDGFAHALKNSAPDFLVTHDPAGHHDARQLPDLVRSFRSTGSGLTIGSRWVRGGSAPGTPRPRALLSRLASFAVARTTGLRRVRDVTTSFRVIRPDAADLVTEQPVTVGDYGYYCEFVAAVQAYGFTVDEVPISFRPRFAPVPRLRAGDLVEFGSDLRRLRRRIRSIRTDMSIDQATWAARSGRLRRQSPEVGSEFGALDELTELSGAGHFTRWIVDEMHPVLGHRVIEIGAGLGSIAAEIADREPERHVTAIEPAANVFPMLRERAAGHTNLDIEQVTSSELAVRYEDDRGADRDHGRFDTAVYVNVLEHIADDVDELRTAMNLLEPGGRLCAFVPAMPSLYGSLDYKSGHYRRYTPEQLRAALDRAGFVDVDVRYLDLLGVVPYWLMYRVLDVSRLDRVSSTGYDRIIVPVSRALQRVVRRPPRGKNLIATARTPS